MTNCDGLTDCWRGRPSTCSETLCSLQLNGNRLQIFPVALTYLENLQDLQMCNNFIGEVPAQVSEQT